MHPLPPQPKNLAGPAFLVVLIAAFAIAALVGFVAMLTVGTLYAEFGWLKPLGYWVSTGLTFGISTIFGLLRAKIPNSS